MATVSSASDRKALCLTFLVAATGVSCGAAARVASGGDRAASCAGQVVHDIQGLTALRSCSDLDGDLVIDGGGLSAFDTIELSALAVVDGSLRIANNPELVSIQMGSLRVVRGELAIENNSRLKSFILPTLQRVQGRFAVDGNDELVEFAVPALVGVAGDLRVAANPGLLDFAVPALKAVDGGLRIEDNESLRVLAAPALVRCGELVIELNPALGSLAAEQFAASIAVAGPVRISDNEQ
jgi:hypothetical protein